MSCVFLGGEGLLALPDTPVVFPDVLTISVSETHILLGRRYLACKCVIALAILDLYPFCSVTVGLDGLTIIDFATGKCASYRLDAAGVAFRARFDEGESVEPETFTAIREAA